MSSRAVSPSLSLTRRRRARESGGCLGMDVARIGEESGRVARLRTNKMRRYRYRQHRAAPPRRPRTASPRQRRRNTSHAPDAKQCHATPHPPSGAHPDSSLLALGPRAKGTNPQTITTPRAHARETGSGAAPSPRDPRAHRVPRPLSILNDTQGADADRRATTRSCCSVGAARIELVPWMRKTHFFGNCGWGGRACAGRGEAFSSNPGVDALVGEAPRGC